MAKEKKKQGVASKDPLYRVIMAVMAICVPIAGYFSNYFYYVVQSDIFKLISQFKGDNTDSGETYGFIGAHKFVQEYLPKLSETQTDMSGVWETLSALKPALISFAAFLALAVIIALVVFFFSCFSKKKLAPLCISLGGVLAMIGVRISFYYISAPLLDRTINLSSFFESSLVSAVLPFIAKLTEFRLTTGYFLMLFLFIAMALWAGANMLIALGDKPQNSQKVK